MLVGQPDHALTVEFRSNPSALWMEIPDAANLDASDGRVHGVRMRPAELPTADGEIISLFATS